MVMLTVNGEVVVNEPSCAWMEYGPFGPVTAHPENVTFPLISLPEQPETDPVEGVIVKMTGDRSFGTRLPYWSSTSTTGWVVKATPDCCEAAEVGAAKTNWVAVPEVPVVLPLASG